MFDFIRKFFHKKDGNIYIAASENETLSRFTGSGRYLDTKYIGEPKEKYFGYA